MCILSNVHVRHWSNSGKKCNYIIQVMLRINFICTSCELALRWRPKNTFDGNGLVPQASLGHELILSSLGQNELILSSLGQNELILSSLDQNELILSSLGQNELILSSLGQNELILLSLGHYELTLLWMNFYLSLSDHVVLTIQFLE